MGVPNRLRTRRDADRVRASSRRAHAGLASGVRRGERQLAIAAVIPTILFYLVFRYYPVAKTLFLSLTNAQLISPSYKFIGLQNFQLLFADPLFLKILWNTLSFAIATTFATTSLALVVAFISDPVQRGGGLLRLIFFLPTITSSIAIATIWLWLYQPRFGLFNQVLSLFGIPPIPWLISTEWAMPSLILMSVWGGVGFSSLIFIAGLKAIPSEFTEAAIMDGASPLQVALRIKLPLLSRVISFVVITGIIGSFQVFQQVYLMTDGGPLDATRVLALQIYEYAFHRLQIGQAAAMAFVLFTVVGLLTAVQLRLQRSDWEL